MKSLRLALILSAFACILAVPRARSAEAPRTPVVLITDIGTDIDDSWALGLALRSPELDVKLVVTDPADTVYRASVTAKFLEAAGRSDIPIAIGDNSGPNGDNFKTLTSWIKGYDISKYPGKVYQDGVSALIDVIEKSPDPVTVIGIGPVNTLAIALKRSPQIAAKCRFVGMYGSFDVGYAGPGKPSDETNVRVNPVGLRSVLSAPWRDILLTPLDTCGSVGLQGERYHAIWSATSDPMLRAIITSYCVFAPVQNWMLCDYFATRSTTLFDCVAVYLAYSESLVNVEAVTFDVTDAGYTLRSGTGAFKARIALSWKDKDAFEAQLSSRLLGK